MSTKPNSPLTGTSVTGELAAESIITVKSLDAQSPAMKAFQEQLAKDKTLGLCVDIQVSGEYGGLLTVTLPVGTEYNGMDVRVFHYVNGEVEILQTTVSNGVAIVQTSSLSPFAVELPNLNGKQPPSKDTTTTLNAKSGTSSVNTGDESHIILFATLLAAAAVIITLLVWKRFRSERQH